MTPLLGPQRIKTGVRGPLPKNTLGLILGRSSATMHGIRVLPGVIDEDTPAEIEVMVESAKGTIIIPPGARFAQLILIPKVPTDNPIHKRDRQGGFGDSGPLACWVSDMQTRPTLQLEIEGRKFTGLLDTGADTTVISQAMWPSSWPLEATPTVLQGIGTSQPQKSARLLRWKDQEGHSGIFQPYVLPHIPINLWGRDLLSAMNVVLTSQPVPNMLNRQGYFPGKGLGRHLQGDPQPVCDKKIEVRSPGDRTGLGHFLQGPL